MKRIARDFTVTMEVPDKTSLGDCEIAITVETASRLRYTKFDKQKNCGMNISGENIKINVGEYYVEEKHV
jgi:hypothetical protein